MNKLTIIIAGIILIIFAILLYTTSAPKKDVTQNLPPEANQFQAINLSPSETNNNQQSAAQGKGNTQSAQPTVGVEEGLKATYSATIKTTKGDIVVTLVAQGAPRTVANFMEKAEKGFYKNLTFHRVEDWVIQGGDPQGNGSGGGKMQTELNDLPFVTGALGIARGADINVSNDSQFFITKTDAPWLNEKYTNFGIVTEGMDVVNNITIGDKILGVTIK